MLGELQEEGQPAADSQHWTLPLAVRPGERFPAQGVPSLPTECVGSRSSSVCRSSRWLLSGRVEEKSARAGKTALRKCGRAGEEPPCLAELCSRVRLNNEHGGQHCCGLYSLFSPARGDTDKHTYLLYLMCMDAWLLPGSGERAAASEVEGGR